MATTCPNCNHPVRTNAKFCGFCGVDLNAAREVKSGAPFDFQDEAGTKLNSKRQKQAINKRFHTGQVVSIIAIILLILIILLAIIARYWSNIVPLLGQFISQLVGR